MRRIAGVHGNLSPESAMICSMSPKKRTSDVKVRRHAKIGRMIPAGYGALKGQYVIRKGVDITKPIYEQVGRRRTEEARLGLIDPAGVLLDTHAAIWLLSGEPMSADALEAIAQAQLEGKLFLSPITGWEAALALTKRDGRPDLGNRDGA